MKCILCFLCYYTFVLLLMTDDVDTSNAGFNSAGDKCGEPSFYVTGLPVSVNRKCVNKTAVWVYHRKEVVNLNCHRIFKLIPPPSFLLRWVYQGVTVRQEPITASSKYTNCTYSFSLKEAGECKEIKCIYEEDKPKLKNVRQEIRIKLQYQDPRVPSVATLKSRMARFVTNTDDTSILPGKNIEEKEFNRYTKPEEFTVIQMSLSLEYRGNYCCVYTCKTLKEYTVTDNSILIISMEGSIDRYWCSVNNVDVLTGFLTRTNSPTLKKLTSRVSPSLQGEWNCIILGYNNPENDWKEKYVYDDGISNTAYLKTSCLFNVIVKAKPEEFEVIQMSLSLKYRDDYKFFVYTCEASKEYTVTDNSVLIIRMNSTDSIDRYWCSINNVDVLTGFYMTKNSPTFKELIASRVSPSLQGEWNCTILGFKYAYDYYEERYVYSDGKTNAIYLKTSCLFNVTVKAPDQIIAGSETTGQDLLGGYTGNSFFGNPIITYASVAAVLCLILLVLVVLAVRRIWNKMKQDQREANNVLYENFTNENTNTNQFPPNLESTYAIPFDSINKTIDDDECPYAVAGYHGDGNNTTDYQDISKLYAKPVPKSVRNLYAKVIPKSQRSKDETENPYAEIPGDTNTYAEVTPKQITYAEIVTGDPKNSNSRLNKENSPYSKIIGVVKKNNKKEQTSGYENVVKDISRYAHAKDTDYAEPAYCELSNQNK